MKQDVTLKKNNLSKLEVGVFGISIVMGFFIGLFGSIYSFLKMELLSVLIFTLLFLFSGGLFFYVENKTKEILPHDYERTDKTKSSRIC